MVCGEPQENVAYKMHPDVNKKFVMRTDASNIGLGATLLQNKVGFFVAYTSRKLLGREKRESAIEREYLGIVWGKKKIALYLYSKEFTLQTDHRPLKFLKVSKFDNSYNFLIHDASIYNEAKQKMKTSNRAT